MPKRPVPPDDVYFPVVPMLDMAFQLLAFFILTFQPPGRETRIDLELPAAPVAFPDIPRSDSSAAGPTAGVGQDGLTPDATIRALADQDGGLVSLRLDGNPVSGTEALVTRLRERALTSPNRRLTVALIADDTLLYEEAARVLGACATSQVATIRLVPAQPRARSGAPEVEP